MMQSMCIRNGCINFIIESLGWDNEYCLNECVVNYCRLVFVQVGCLRRGGGCCVYLDIQFKLFVKYIKYRNYEN